MPVNEFEKQVQQKMDELKFTPSPEVWSEVEMRIRKEKKRRRVIFWWLMPLLLVGGGMVYYYGNSARKDKVEVKDKDKDKVEVGSGVVTSIIPPRSRNNIETVFVDQSNKSNNKVINQDKKRIDIIGHGFERVLSPSELEVLLSTPKKKLRKAGNTDESDPIIVKEEIQIESGVAEKYQVNPIPVPVTEKVDEKNGEAKEKSINETTQVIQTQNDSSININEKEKIDPVEPLKINQSNKWKFGFSTELGSSNTKWGPLLGGQARYADFAQYSAPSGVGSGSSAINPVYIPAPENGFSFGLSMFAEKDLSRKLELRASIQYNNYSTHTTIGNHIDSTRSIYNSITDRVVNNYYRPPTTSNPGKDYTNHYHLVGLSVSLGWKIIDKEKFRLSWENGLGYHRLISTNALHFDRNLGAYYEDFDAFKKSQFIFTTGLSAPIIRKSKFELTLNPFISYGLSPILKGMNGPKSHFINGGVGLRFSFPR